MTDSMALAFVENLIIRKKVALSRLYVAKNTFSFVSRLPDEILANIFILCASDDYYRDGERCWTVVPRWINVSYVCHRWRNIALNCATLWTYITLMPLRWIEVLLERSKEASLKMRIHIRRYAGSPPLSLYLVKRALDHGKRIQELQLSFPFEYANEILSYSFLRAPRLQNLKISTFDDLPFASPVVPFDGDAPSLQSLELENIRVSLSLLNARGLRTLRLCGGPSKEGIKDFLSTLRCMDSLVHLWLDQAFPCCQEFVFSPAFNALQKIRLPQLSRLLIAGPISTVTALLSSLDFPPKAKVRLDYAYGREISLEDYTLFTSVLAHKYASIISADVELSMPEIRSLVIRFAGRRQTLTCIASERGPDFDSPSQSLGWDRNVPLQISLLDFEGSEEHMGEICHALPLTHLQNVHVYGLPASLDFWKRAFGHLRELRYIKLNGGAGGVMPDLTPILVVDGLAENHDADRMFAPALEVLELRKLTFPVRRDHGDTFGPDLQSLRNALATRKARERPVKLSMDGCYEDLVEEDQSEAEDEDESDDDYYCPHGSCRACNRCGRP